MKNFPKTFKYTLSKCWVDKVADLLQFCDGGKQVHILTKDGAIYKQVLISNSMYVIAINGYKDLPFGLDDIADIYQTEEDENITRKEFDKQENWYYWDWENEFGNT
jgi:hypothetical protein